jgi:hypothetical protein
VNTFLSPELFLVGRKTTTLDTDVFHVMSMVAKVSHLVRISVPTGFHSWLNNKIHSESQREGPFVLVRTKNSGKMGTATSSNAMVFQRQHSTTHDVLLRAWSSESSGELEILGETW